MFCYRWKTHKWSKCHLAPWLLRQNSSGAQETCGTGLQTRGEETHLFIHFITWISLFSHLFTGFIVLPLLTSPFSIGGPVVKPLCFCPLILPALSCLQLNGTQADVAECLEFTKAVPSITQPCQLPCQDDCQLTNWSKFSSCTVDCVGVRIRKRALIGGMGLFAVI